MQQQMFNFFSGCFRSIYNHLELPQPQLPTTQQLQYYPAGPPPPVGGFVQTPLASFPLSPLLQTGVFASPAPPVTAAQVTQPDSLAAILQRLSDQQDRFAAAQLSMQAEQAR